jgi:hypothetical protein
VVPVHAISEVAAAAGAASGRDLKKNQRKITPQAPQTNSFAEFSEAAALFKINSLRLHQIVRRGLRARHISRRTAMVRKFKCSICSDIIEGEYGNNPHPFTGNKCCDYCNEVAVISARMAMMVAREEVLELTKEERAGLRAHNRRAREAIRKAFAETDEGAAFLAKH